MAETNTAVETVCGACGAKRAAKATKKGNPRLPKGWKERPDPESGQPVRTCAECWKKLYRLRAVTFPVAEVLDGGTWKEFCAAVKDALGRSRSLAQWCVNQLAQTDVVRNGQAQMPPHPPIYLYGLAGQHYHGWSEWAGAMTAANAILHAVELKYGARRREVVWWGSAALPTIRSMPYPVPSQNWRAAWTEYTSKPDASGHTHTSRVPSVSIPLGGRRWLLRLRGGRQRARQLAAFAHIVSGAAECGELAIYRKRSQASRDRSGMTERAPGGGQKIRSDIVVKLVAWLPRECREKVRAGALTVHSGQHYFLAALHPDFERPWKLNRNEVRRRIFVHARRLQQISEDAKAEIRRMPNPSGPWRQLTVDERRQRRERKQAYRHRLEYYQKICGLYHDYLRTFVQEAAAWLAAYADRLGVSKVCLDLSERRYCPGFAWAALQNRIEANLEDRGIDLETTADTMDDDEETEAVEPNNNETPAEETT